jgi:hypothetical protein
MGIRFAGNVFTGARWFFFSTAVNCLTNNPNDRFGSILPLHDTAQHSGSAADPIGRLRGADSTPRQEALAPFQAIQQRAHTGAPCRH